jgi:hypothetical protein
MIPYFNITAIEEQRRQSRRAISEAVFQDDSGYGVVFAYHRHYRGKDIYFFSRGFYSFVPKQYESKIYCLPDWQEQILFGGDKKWKEWYDNTYKPELEFVSGGPCREPMRFKLKRKKVYANMIIEIPVYSLLPNEIADVFKSIVSQYSLPYTETKVTPVGEPYIRDIQLDKQYSTFVYPIDETDHLIHLNRPTNRNFDSFEPKEVKTELLAILVPIRDFNCIRNPDFIPSPPGSANQFFQVNSPAEGLDTMNHPDIMKNWKKSLRVKPKHKTAVLVPCAGTKPFPESPSHKHGYLEALEGKNVDVYIVSEPLGIVPYNWSRTYPNDSYDFPPKHVKGQTRDELVRRFAEWYNKVGTKYKKIYKALPGHHLSLVNDAGIPGVDASISACRDSDCSSNIFRATSGQYVDFLRNIIR